MGACRFSLSETNPNNGIGGGGCACSELANPDQAGPYMVFPATEMSNNLSPYTVVCLGCAEHGIAKAVDAPSDILKLGEDDAPPFIEGSAEHGIAKAVDAPSDILKLGEDDAPPFIEGSADEVEVEDEEELIL